MRSKEKENTFKRFSPLLLISKTHEERTLISSFKTNLEGTCQSFRRSWCFCSSSFLPAASLHLSPASLLLCLFQHQKHYAKFSKSLLKATVKTLPSSRRWQQPFVPNGSCKATWMHSCAHPAAVSSSWDKCEIKPILLQLPEIHSQWHTVQSKFKLKMCKNLPRHLKSQLINSAVCCVCSIQNKIAWGIRACENSLGYETTY